jgi:hypothetical protein
VIDIARRLVTIVFVVAQSGLFPYLQVSLAQDQAGQPGAQLQQTADQVERLLAAIEASAAEIPRDTFDPGAIVELVGGDPGDLFEWVRDETYLVPYRGVLKGPVGVLMDRLGNSLDRALLLHELLRIAGHEARLARADITGDQALRLLELSRAVPEGGAIDSSSSGTEPDVHTLLESYEAVAGPAVQEELKQQFESAIRLRERLPEVILQRVTEQTEIIAAAIDVPDREAGLDDREWAQAALQDHWWVQYRVGDGWMDLDPTFDDSKPGQAVAQVEETLVLNELADLGAELIHTVQVSVVVECWDQGILTETRILESPLLLPAELYGDQIVLRHVPTDWEAGPDLDDEATFTQNFRAAVLAQSRWTPILAIGPEVIASKGVTDTCLIDDASTMLPGAAELGRSVGGMLGGAIGGLGVGENETALIGQWLEYAIRSPGRPERIIRREVFDLLGPAARSAGEFQALELSEAQRLERGVALLGETEILPQASQISPQFVFHLTTQSLTANRESITGPISDTASQEAGLLSEDGKMPQSPPGDLHSLAVVRWHWSRMRGDVYFDRPNLFSLHTRVGFNPEGDLVSFQGFDIVANELAVRAGSMANPFLVRLEQGVLDTTLEAVLATANCLRAQGIDDCAELENPAEIIKEGRRQGIAMAVMEGADDPAWRDVDLPEDVRARAMQDAAEGNFLVIPERPVRLGGRGAVGWWRVDPLRGHTLGIGDRGWGQTATEDFVVKSVAVLSTVFAIACTVRATKDIFTLELDPAQAAALGAKTGFCLAGGVVCAFAVTFIFLSAPIEPIIVSMTWNMLTLCGVLVGVGSLFDDLVTIFT